MNKLVITGLNNIVVVITTIAYNSNRNRAGGVDFYL